MTTKHDDDEMSMQDILASIRRYVADETSSEQIDRSSSSYNQEASFQEKRTYQQTREDPFFDPSAPEVIHLTERREVPPAPSFTEAVNKNSNLEPKFTSETLVSEKAQTVSSQAFSRLAEAVRPQTPPFFKATSSSSGGNGLTLDHLISELARPMIKQWLDNNLPSLVESLVNKEIERIARLNSTR